VRLGVQHQVNGLGYGKNARDWTIRSQASSQEVEGSETKWLWVADVSRMYKVKAFLSIDRDE